MFTVQERKIEYPYNKVFKSRITLHLKPYYHSIETRDLPSEEVNSNTLSNGHFEQVKLAILKYAD